MEMPRINELGKNLFPSSYFKSTFSKSNIICIFFNRKFNLLKVISMKLNIRYLLLFIFMQLKPNQNKDEN